MFKVNIYIGTDGKDQKARHRVFAAIVEFISKKGEPVTREASGKERATYNGIVLIAFAASLRILNKSCEVTVYADCPYLSGSIQSGRADEWARHGWKTIRGEPVANCLEWEKAHRLMKGHKIIFAPGKGHSYTEVLQYKVNKLAGAAEGGRQIELAELQHEEARPFA